MKIPDQLKLESGSWKRMATLLLMCYLVLCAYGCMVADSIIFKPHPARYTDDKHIIKLETKSGEVISACWKKKPNAKYTILFSHGNAEDIGDFFYDMSKYNLRGYSIMTYDYRGYGTSEGDPSESNTYEDIQAAYDHLIANGVTADKIIVCGRSVGGGPSTWLASREPVKALILESAFTSAFRVITHYRVLPFDKYNNVGLIDEINCPLLVIHGDKDLVIPVWHGKALYEEAELPKTIHIVEGAGHNNLHAIARETYWKVLKKFTDSL